MKKIIDRLSEYIEFKGISLNAFDKSIGTSNGYIGKQIKNQASIGGDVLEKIFCTYTDLNVDWLILDEGKMLRSDKKENTLVEKPVSDTIALNDSVDMVKRIPLVSPCAVAGFGNGDFAINNNDIKDYYVVPLFKDRHIDFMIEVSGNSMYPRYSNGDVVACIILRERRFIQWNKVHLISTVEQGILIKRIKKGQNDQHLLLISDNKDYDPFIINIEDITGMAIVVGVIHLE